MSTTPRASLSAAGSSDDTLAAPGEVSRGVADRKALELSRGAPVGRYMVLAKLGAGGMGVVYAAYDPELDRKVALKLLHPSTQDGTEGRARMLREAQALAKLSHPNIVGVHDIGTVGARVWIAMEFVAGTTLRMWLEHSPRSWREVLAVMRSAGRGLAAAHDAGLVHRDFKPDNVMVGDDGRVRVMDFGLARAVGEAAIGHENAEDARPRVAALHEDVTQAGALSGTPAYMAAEQFGGRPGDAHSDQFGFCVTTWEGLFGTRPFVGDTLVALATEVLSGRVRTPTKSVLVPGWLRSIVERGLAPDPAQRWPTMADLLSALERGHARARARRVLVGVGVFGLVGVAGTLAYHRDVQQRITTCEQAGTSIEEVWNQDTSQRIHAAMAATQLSYAETTANKVMPWLDGHAQAWRHARTEACLDADVRQVWDADTLDRSLWCLDERRLELESLIGELLVADESSVHKAVIAAGELTAPDGCRDTSRLARLPPPPTERREEVRAVRVELSRAYALDRAGKYAQGLELARAAHESANRLAWPPLMAAAGAREAKLLDRQGEYEAAEQVGAQAYFEAARIGAWDVAAGAATNLAFVVGFHRARHADGLAWGQHAAVALAHAGDTDDLREATRISILATVHRFTGDHAQAQTLHERALAIREKALGPEHPDVAASLNNLANLHYATAELTLARPLYERALAIWEEALGPEHPDVAASLNNLANVYQAAREYGLAQTTYERAVAIWEKALGPDHPDFAHALVNLAQLHYVVGDYSQARTLHERALAIWEKVGGPDHIDVAASLAGLADVSVAVGDNRGAVRLLERAIKIYSQHAGVQQGEPAAAFALAKGLIAGGGDRSRARALAEQARAGWREAGEAEAERLAEIEQWLAPR